PDEFLMKTVQGFHPSGVLRTPKFIPDEFLMKTIQGFHPSGVLRTPKFIPDEFFWIPDRVRDDKLTVPNSPHNEGVFMMNNIVQNAKQIITRKRRYQLSQFVLLWLFAVSAQASQVAQYPWAQTLKKIMDSMSGPVAYSCAGIAIVISGISMAFFDLQGGAKRFVQAALGISITFGAVTLLSTFFSFTGAVVM
ncbi:MAG: TrbC/VIRB2 family protein, partial [Gammaproteobacteria bacterium]|nr:TrbC/VIRB2 family protein [Gammaproteobacteria bacterium]